MLQIITKFVTYSCKKFYNIAPWSHLNNNKQTVKALDSSQTCVFLGTTRWRWNLPILLAKGWDVKMLVMFEAMFVE